MKKVFLLSILLCGVSCTVEEEYTVQVDPPPLLVTPEVCAHADINVWSPEMIAYLTVYANQPLIEWNIENFQIVEYSLRYRRMSNPFYQRVTYIDPLLFTSLDETKSVPDASPWRFVSARGVTISVPQDRILDIFSALTTDPINVDGVYVQITYKVNGQWYLSTLTWVTSESACTGIFD